MLHHTIKSTIILIFVFIMLCCFIITLLRKNTTETHLTSPVLQSTITTNITDTQYIGLFDNGGVIFDSDFIKNTQKLHYKEPNAFTNFVEDYTRTIKKQSKEYPKY